LKDPGFVEKSDSERFHSERFRAPHHYCATPISAPASCTYEGLNGLPWIFWLAVFWLLHFPVILSSGYAIFWLLHFPVIAFSCLSISRLLHFQIIAFSGLLL
jgi:hypothetical protein